MSQDSIVYAVAGKNRRKVRITSVVTWILVPDPVPYP